MPDLSKRNFAVYTKTIILTLLCIFGGSPLDAQENDYELMKKRLNRNSIPLVNVIVDTGAINKKSYIDGEIEIADYYRRTDSLSETIRLHCKYRVRGETASLYEKKSFAVKLTDKSGEDLDSALFGQTKIADCLVFSGKKVVFAASIVK